MPKFLQFIGLVWIVFFVVTVVYCTVIYCLKPEDDDFVD